MPFEATTRINLSHQTFEKGDAIAFSADEESSIAQLLDVGAIVEVAGKAKPGKEPAKEPATPA